MVGFRRSRGRMSRDDDVDLSRVIATTVLILTDAVPSTMSEPGAQRRKRRPVTHVAARIGPLDSTVLIHERQWCQHKAPYPLATRRVAAGAWLHVWVDCGALAKTLHERELLMTYAAPSPAVHERAGAFEAAHRGTLIPHVP
jgi:hypothetical protein